MTDLPEHSKGQQSELTPRDDVKKSVSEILKRVDNLIRKGELEQAEIGVTKAREIDPRNIYAFAFEERIHLLKQQAQENSIAAAVCKAAEEQRRTQEADSSVNTAADPKIAPKPTPSPGATVPKNSPPIQQSGADRVLTAKSTPPVASDPPFSKTPRPSIPEPSPGMSEAQRNQHEARPDTEAGRDIRIQRMIKNAVDAVRDEIEQKRSELRARQFQNNARQEEQRIAEAAERARRAEEERQQEFRKKVEERLLQQLKAEYEQQLREKFVDLPKEDLPVSTEPPPRQPKEPPAEKRSALVSPERQETLSRYMLVLASVWVDGAVSTEEEATLKELRQSLSISDQEHTALEKDVKRQAYVEAFKKAWNSGHITPENASILADLRKRFQISNEEHLKIESTLLWEIQPQKHRPTLLVVDDDERLLAIVSKTLNDAGFITQSVTTSDEAYAYLRDSRPDLILCDVNLETSTMGGFAFYEKVREMEQMRETPFIFLSGLSDEALVRTGKELGVDDYLSKPVSEETLIATIKGKLRRYQELRKRLN